MHSRAATRERRANAKGGSVTPTQRRMRAQRECKGCVAARLTTDLPNRDANTKGVLSCDPQRLAALSIASGHARRLCAEVYEVPFGTESSRLDQPSPHICCLTPPPS